MWQEIDTLLEDPAGRLSLLLELAWPIKEGEANGMLVQFLQRRVEGLIDEVNCLREILDDEGETELQAEDLTSELEQIEEESEEALADESEQAEEIPEKDPGIETLYLSVRSENVLKRRGIKTVNEVMNFLSRDEGELLEIRYFGEKTLAELKRKLALAGYLPGETILPMDREEAVVALGLGPYLTGILMGNDIITIGELLDALTADQLLEINGINRCQLRAIKQELKAWKLL
ncbi:MAG: DNA-directed RNA polymerase subunit alpha C-terminal domain-containing protein [Candidatus Shapirobacteria bacterium]